MIIRYTFEAIFEIYAVLAQSVERHHGKVEVSGSIPENGSGYLRDPYTSAILVL